MTDMFPEGAKVDPKWYAWSPDKDQIEAIRQAIRNAGYGAMILSLALEAECGPGGTQWDDEHGYMNPAMALTFAKLLDRDPIQSRAALGYTKHLRPEHINSQTGNDE